MGRPIVVSILGDTRDLVSKLGQGESRLGKFGKVGKVAGAALVGGLATAGVAAAGFAISAVKSASDAQQSLGATETVFGKYAGSIVKNSNRAAQTVGLSANSYRESANLIGSLFKNQGVASDQLAAKTDNMVRTGADLAATYGGTTKDAVEALGSAFKGEFDPLEKYGISIKQSTINAALAAKGEDKLTGAALKAAQQRATTALITKQAGGALGSFGRESDTLAGQQQRLGASWENIKAKAGSVLLPALTSVASFANTKLLPGLGKAAAGFGPIAKEVAGRLGPAFKSLLPAGQAFVSTLTGTILPAAVRLGGYLGRTFGPVFATIGRILVGQVLPTVVRFATFIYSTLYPAIVRIVSQVGQQLRPVFTQLATTFQTQILPALSRLWARFEQARPTIQKVILVVVKVAGVFLRLGAAILGRVLPPLIKVAGFLIGRVVRAVGAVFSALVRIVGGVIRFGAALVNGYRKVQAFSNKVDAIIRSLPGRILRALGNAGNFLVGKGRDFINGLVRGVGDRLSNVRNRVQDAIGKAKDALSGAGSALVQKGRDLINGLAQGIGEKIGAAIQKVKDGLQKIKNMLPGSPIKEGPLKSWNNGGAGKRLIGMLALGLRDTRPIRAAMTVATKAIAEPTALARPVAAMAGGGLLLAGGGGGITINVEVPVGATGADIGRELAAYLRDYFSAGGARP